MFVFFKMDKKMCTIKQLTTYDAELFKNEDKFLSWLKAINKILTNYFKFCNYFIKISGDLTTLKIKKFRTYIRYMKIKTIINEFKNKKNLSIYKYRLNGIMESLLECERMYNDIIKSTKSIGEPVDIITYVCPCVLIRKRVFEVTSINVHYMSTERAFLYYCDKLASKYSRYIVLGHNISNNMIKNIVDHTSYLSVTEYMTLYHNTDTNRFYNSDLENTANQKYLFNYINDHNCLPNILYESGPNFIDYIKSCYSYNIIKALLKYNYDENKINKDELEILLDRYK